MSLLRICQVQERTGLSRTRLYLKIRTGLLPQLVKIDKRATAIPASELDAVIAAQIGGATDDQIRALVSSLHAKRKSDAAAVLAEV